MKPFFKHSSIFRAPYSFLINESEKRVKNMNYSNTKSILSSIYQNLNKLLLDIYNKIYELEIKLKELEEKIQKLTS